MCAKGYDADRQTFTQSYGSRALDAALLLIPQVGFLPPEDERVRGTLRAVQRELAVDGMVRRYDTDDTDDGVPGDEGAFLACSFWLADALVLDGQVDAGRQRFERLLTLRNDVGLLAEEYDVAAGRQLGNVPQAYSHLALVNSALNLAQVASPGDGRGPRRPTAAPLATADPVRLSVLVSITIPAVQQTRKPSRSHPARPSACPSWSGSATTSCRTPGMGAPAAGPVHPTRLDGTDRCRRR